MTNEEIEAFGDPGLSWIIRAIREAREEFAKSMGTDRTKADSEAINPNGSVPAPLSVPTP